MSANGGTSSGADASVPATSLTQVRLGLGWSLRSGDETYDLDASAFMLGSDGRVLSDDHFVFYGNARSPDGAIVHGGDERSGGSDQQDVERIEVDLRLVPAGCTSIVFSVSIDEAEHSAQNFGRVPAAYVRVIKPQDEVELARYDLSEDASFETAMVFGELYRQAGGWAFRAIGQGYPTGLRGIALELGVDVL